MKTNAARRYDFDVTGESVQIIGLDRAVRLRAVPRHIPGLSDALARPPGTLVMRPFSEKHQKFLNSRKLVNGIVGGYGSAKSMALCAKTYKVMRDTPGLEHYMAGLNFSTTRDTLVPTMKSVLSFLRVPFKYQAGPMRFTLPNRATLQMLSANNWTRWPGRNAASFAADEAARWDEGAYLQMHARVRTSPQRQINLATTPEGFNWLYRTLGNVSEDDPLTDVTFVRTDDNTALPEGYAENLTRVYGEKLAQGYRDGEFVDVRSGRVYYAAVRSSFGGPCHYHPDRALYVTLDFNVDPGVAVLLHRFGDVFEAFGEVHIEDSTTKAVCREIVHRFPNHQAPCYVYGDAAGGQKKSSAERTDWQIVDEVLRPHFPEYKRRVPKANPYVIDRVNAVNAAFEKRRIRINIDRCPNLVVDLDQVTWKPGTHDLLRPALKQEEAGIDKGKKSLTHLTDALGYLIHYEMPLVKPTLGGGVAVNWR